MKFFLFLVFVIITALCSVSCEKSGVADNIIEIKDEVFTKINSSSFYDIKLVRSDSPSVRVEIPQMFVGLFDVEIVDGTLELKYENTEMISIRERKGVRAVAYISIPTLEEINLNGMCTLVSETFSHDGKFKLILDGKAHITRLTLNCDDLDLDVMGMSSVEITVKVSNHANIKVSDKSKCILYGTAKTSSFNIDDSSVLNDFGYIGDF